MKIQTKNLYLALGIAQTVFTVLGFWAPNDLRGVKKLLFNCYTLFSYFFLNGSYLIVQGSYLYQVWGNVNEMTDAMFLCVTNLSLCVKIVNMYRKQKAIQAMIDETNTDLSEEKKPEGLFIIKRNDRNMKIQLFTYSGLAGIAIVGWAYSAEKGKLPFKAWYPYDTSKSPAYELTYAHQISALTIAACLNICLDTLVTSLINQCQCRFKLLSLSLRNLFDGLLVTEKGIISPEDDIHLALRLNRCIKQHQAILRQAALMQDFFSIPILGQFTVSMVIICVIAYQMALVNQSMIWFFSMLLYMEVMLIQVFVYCYHGDNLVTESGNVAEAVYACPWYLVSPAQRKCLQLMMMRAQREARLKAGNLTELSLVSFMAIVKASYSFFTVLQNVEEDS